MNARIITSSDIEEVFGNLCEDDRNGFPIMGTSVDEQKERWSEGCGISFIVDGRAIALAALNGSRVSMAVHHDGFALYGRALTRCIRKLLKEVYAEIGEVIMDAHAATELVRNWYTFLGFREISADKWVYGGGE